MEEYHKQLSEHPELGDADGTASPKETSAPPMTSAGTPQPRIRLNINSASNTNGVGSAARSEDGDD